MSDDGSVLGRLAPALELLAANAEEADRSGELPAENIAALRQAGAFAWSRPRSLGGDELPATAKVEAWEALAAADLCTLWVFANYDSFVWELSFRSRFDPFPELEALLCEEQPVAGTIAMVPGSLLEGGELVVNGRFPFATGCGHARWLRANVVVPGPAPDDPAADEAATSHVRSVMVDLGRPEVRIERTWDGAGLRASQTDTVVVEGLRLPLTHSAPMAYDAIRQDPARPVPSPYYREPGWAMANARAGASLAGGALAMFSEALAHVAGTRTNFSGSPAARFPAVRQNMAEAYIEIETARALQRAIAHESDDRVAAGAPWDAAVEARTWGAGTASTQAVLRALDRMALALGGTGWQRGLPFERHVRDIRTGATHLGLNPNLVNERVSGHLFGKRA